MNGSMIAANRKATGVIRSVVNPAQRHGIPFDMLPVTFNDPKLLKRICYRYLSRLGVNRWTIRKAFRRALEAQAEFKQEVRQKAKVEFGPAYSPPARMAPAAGVGPAMP